MLHRIEMADQEGGVPAPKPLQTNNSSSNNNNNHKTKIKLVNNKYYI